MEVFLQASTYMHTFLHSSLDHGAIGCSSFFLKNVKNRVKTRDEIGINIYRSYWRQTIAIQMSMFPNFKTKYIC
jgi:hypothetical protein